MDLKAGAGQRVFKRLAERADVVIESFKPGTAKRLGVDYESVRAINESIVYCSVSGFGQTGPYHDLIGHEPNYQALSGAIGQNHEPGGPPIMSPGPVGDLGGGGSNALVAVLAALMHRARTGEGQYIDVAITAGILPYVAGVLYAEWTDDPYRKLSISSNVRPELRVYETRDGRHLVVSAEEPWLWERMCRALGREDLFAEHAGHGRRPAQVAAALADVFRTRSLAEWVELNAHENLSISPVLGPEEIELDPQMRHRQMVVEIDYEPLGRVKQIGIPFQMSVTPPEIRWIPRYGEHTSQVLGELGFDSDDIARLRSEGVCE